MIKMDKEIKKELQRELLINRAVDNVTNSKWVDSDGNMVGIKKDGKIVSVEVFSTDMEKKGLQVMWSDNYRGINIKIRKTKFDEINSVKKNS